MVVCVFIGLYDHSQDYLSYQMRLCKNVRQTRNREDSSETTVRLSLSMDSAEYDITVNKYELIYRNKVKRREMRVRLFQHCMCKDMNQS